MSLVLGSVLAVDAQQPSALKIVVLEGEGAVNIIQQKTAVRPLVEVRDRNNLPVAGATVTFSIGGGGSGAAFAGGAAGGGGGVSATTIGIIGAAVGGGALAATQVLGQAAEEVFDVYTGSLTGQLIFTTLATTAQGQQTACDRTQAVTGSMTIELREGNSTGTARMQVSQNEVSVTGPCGPNPPATFSLFDVAVTGGPSTLTFTGSSSGPTISTVVFNGSLSGNTITGTARISIVQQGSGTGTSASGSGSTTLQVTLQR